NWIHPSIQMLSSEFRGFALIIILLRAGFGLDRQNLAQVGRPAVTSGIRLGSPAMTSRGFKEEEFKKIAHWIHEALTH
ncbi:hypothetical protein PT111_09055, partial [Erysipelothrix rhusiopathiae]|nr:hypothetical protein [Erysipelothrix rhusiopathiae]